MNGNLGEIIKTYENGRQWHRTFHFDIVFTFLADMICFKEYILENTERPIHCSYGNFIKPKRAHFHQDIIIMDNQVAELLLL